MDAHDADPPVVPGESQRGPRAPFPTRSIVAFCATLVVLTTTASGVIAGSQPTGRLFAPAETLALTARVLPVLAAYGLLAMLPAVLWMRRRRLHLAPSLLLLLLLSTGVALPVYVVELTLLGGDGWTGVRALSFAFAGHIVLLPSGLLARWVPGPPPSPQ